MERAEAGGVSGDVLATAIALIGDLRKARKNAAAEALRVELLAAAKDALAARAEQHEEEEEEADDDELLERIAELEAL